MMGMKEYVRPEDGYSIRVTEKAYNLFYRKQGFVPVLAEPDKAAADPKPGTGPESDKGAAPDPEADAASKKKRTKKASTNEQ